MKQQRCSSSLESSLYSISRSPRSLPHRMESALVIRTSRCFKRESRLEIELASALVLLIERTIRFLKTMYHQRLLHPDLATDTCYGFPWRLRRFSCSSPSGGSTGRS